MNEQQLEVLEEIFPKGCVVVFFRPDRKPSNIRIGASDNTTSRVEGTLDEVYEMIQKNLPEIVQKHS